MRNYGFIADEIVPEKDYILGGFGSLGGEILQPTGQWIDWVPLIEEIQAKGIEPQSCVSHNTLNAVEILLRRIFTFTRDYSDRFLAKKSGTDPQRGNSPQKVSECLRKGGVALEIEWPYSNGMTLEEFYKEPPEHITVSAKKFIVEFSFFHEYVPNVPKDMMEALKYSPLGCSFPAWFRNENGLYYRPPNAIDNHWAVIVGYKENEYWLVLDTYIDEGGLIKKVAWDFKPSQVKRYQLIRNVKEEGFWNEFLTVYDKIVKALEKFLTSVVVGEVPVYPDDPPVSIPSAWVVPSAPVELPHKNELETMCLAIKTYEGWIEPGGKDWSGKVYPSGSLSYRNLNPGNLRALSGSFLRFPSYAEGMKALEDYVIRVGTGHHKAYPKGGKTTLLEFFKIYAPSSDNNHPERYAAFVASKLAVGVDYSINNVIS